MGTGGSKSTALVVMDDARLNAENKLNAELQGESSRPAAEAENGDVMDLVTLNKFNVKTVANFKALKVIKEGEVALKAKDQDQVTQDGDPSTSSDSLLTSFSEKYPAVVAAFSATNNHYQALKEALDSGNLSSQVTLDHVKGLFNVYIKDKTPKNRAALTEFALAIGIPKLAYEVIIDRRNNNQGLTTWDREIEEEKRKEGSETSASGENQVAFRGKGGWGCWSPEGRFQLQDGEGGGWGKSAGILTGIRGYSGHCKIRHFFRCPGQIIDGSQSINQSIVFCK